MIRIAMILGLMANLSSFGFAADDAMNWPKRVLIIRHAEKLADDTASVHLSPQGDERAKNLAKLFEKTDQRPEPFAKPDYIFAGKDKSSSHRPNDTVAALAGSLKLTVNSKISTDDPEKLAKELLGGKYAGKTVLICWRHSTMHDLAVHLKADDAPKEWKDSIFDRVWQIEYENGKAKFHDLPQQLMPGDSKK